MTLRRRGVGGGILFNRWNINYDQNSSCFNFLLNREKYKEGIHPYNFSKLISDTNKN